MNLPTIVYIYPAADGPKHTDLALRFIETYNMSPPGMDHETVIVLNGAKRTTEIACMFSSLRRVRFLEHDDSGWDIGGYQTASRLFPAEMMVFFGGSTYFPRSGWLVRMATAFQMGNNHIYGATANRGDPGVHVEPHIRTTGFWMSSELFNRYPLKVTRNDQRYPFEHGKGCLTEWITKQQKGKAWLVTWAGTYEWLNWDQGQQGFYRWQNKVNGYDLKFGQSSLLVGDRLTI